MSELVLYDAGGTPSPRRVKMCLIEKGLPFTIKWLNIALMDQKAPAYLKLNPTGLVPTLVHEGRALYEFERHQRVHRSGISQSAARSEGRLWPGADADVVCL